MRTSFVTFYSGVVYFSRHSVRHSYLYSVCTTVVDRYIAYVRTYVIALVLNAPSPYISATIMDTATKQISCSICLVMCVL